MRTLLLSLTFIGCGNPQKAAFPAASSDDADTDTDTDTDADADADVDCDPEWTSQADGVTVQPSTCLAWTEESEETMEWYTAVSLEEAELGGCRDACPEEGDGYCASLAGLGGRDDWRMPNKSELISVAQGDPPWDDIDQRLWSLDTDANVPDNAWCVNLSDPGSTMGIPKEGTNLPVRCVAGP